MIYSHNGKKMNIPEAELTNLMTNLKITRMEALQVWLEDNGHLFNEEQEELEKKTRGQKVDRGVEKRQTAYKRERKPNEEKQTLVAAVAQCLESLGGVEGLKTVKPEREVSFMYGGQSYSITLTCHRTK